MLNKQENEVMRAVFSLCADSGRCLATPTEILHLLPAREKCSEEKLDKILRALELDEYFELLTTDRKGEKMYVITLSHSGFAYRRESAKLKRDVAYKLFWAILSAVLAFLVGALLKRIF